MNDNGATLKKIMRHASRASNVCIDAEENFLERLEVIKDFLKYGFDDHLIEKSSCSSHSIEHALSRCSGREVHGRQSTECSGCMRIFEFCADIADLCDRLSSAQ